MEAFLSTCAQGSSGRQRMRISTDFMQVFVHSNGPTFQCILAVEMLHFLKDFAQEEVLHQFNVHLLSERTAGHRKRGNALILSHCIHTGWFMNDLAQAYLFTVQQRRYRELDFSVPSAAVYRYRGTHLDASQVW